MPAICREWRPHARGKPPYRQRRQERLWPMVIQSGRSRRVENPPFRSNRNDLLPSETFPSTVPTPALPRAAFSPISGPCVKSPRDQEPRPVRHPYPLSVSMTNLMLRFLPRTMSQGNASAIASIHAAPGSSRPSLTRTGALTYPSCPVGARPRRQDVPGICPSWEELLGER